MKTFSLAAYTFSHFAVDYCCFWILFGAFSEDFSGGEKAIGFMTYNFIAFGLQMIIGSFCDRKRNFPAGSFGCALVLLALCIAEFSSVAALLITALGNAFFHVGGGIDSLVNAGGKLARSGVFVSAGALGVVLGTLTKPALPIPAALASVSFMLCLFAQRLCGAKGNADIRSVASKSFPIWSVLSLALISVVIRSLGGTAIPMEWKVTEIQIFAAAFAAFAGKFLGGFAADKFGAKNTGVATLLLSMPFLVLGREIMVLSLIGIVLFNMTMPITLGICAEKLPENPGLAFGLTTAALLIGAVPGFFVALGGNLLLLLPAIIISAVCIFFSAENKTKTEV